MSLKVWKGPTNGLVTASDSPMFEYGDRVRATDKYKGLQSLCALNMVPRGAFGTGFRSGWVCNQSQCTNERGGIGTLTIQWEAGGAGAIQPLPVGGFSLKPQELYPKIERAGCFAGITGTTCNIVYNALYSATTSSGSILGGEASLTTNIADGVNGYTSGTAATQLALAQLLLAKLLRGEETFYLAGWRYTYEQFTYTAPTINRGGQPGTPGGPLAAVLPAGVSWLRLADDLDPAGVNGSMFKLNVTWLGGPVVDDVGFWDSDVYT
jgi:hypothetical protein